MLTPREKSPLLKLRGGLNSHRFITQDSKPNTLPTERFRPRVRTQEAQKLPLSKLSVDSAVDFALFSDVMILSIHLSKLLICVIRYVDNHKFHYKL